MTLLPPLASVDDLAARNVTVPNSMVALDILDSASDAVRDAAGCAISASTSTVGLVAEDRCGLDLPGWPVSAVTSVTIEGSPVPASMLAGGIYSDGWRLVGHRLLFQNVRFVVPAVVTVTYTHGYAVIPADIIDLVCGMVAMASAADGEYGAGATRAMIKLGTYAETFRFPAGADSPSPVELPDAVRNRLRARFGAAAITVKV